MLFNLDQSPYLDFFFYFGVTREGTLFLEL